MATTKDPAATAQKWAQRLGASTQAITDGVNAVTQAPGARAAAQVDVWLAKINAARDKWVRNVSSVTLQQWQSAMIAKGVPRVGPGATAAVPAMTTFFTQFLPFVQQGVSSLPARGTFDQNMQRAYQMAQHNSQFVYRRATT